MEISKISVAENPKPQDGERSIFMLLIFAVRRIRRYYADKRLQRDRDERLVGLTPSPRHFCGAIWYIYSYKRSIFYKTVIITFLVCILAGVAGYSATYPQLTALIADFRGIESEETVSVTYLVIVLLPFLVFIIFFLEAVIKNSFCAVSADDRFDPVGAAVGRRIRNRSRDILSGVSDGVFGVPGYGS